MSADELKRLDKFTKLNPPHFSDTGSIKEVVAGLQDRSTSTTPSLTWAQFSKDASLFFDPGSTYSYVSSYFASFLDMPHSSLDALMHVSTPGSCLCGIKVIFVERIKARQYDDPHLFVPKDAIQRGGVKGVSIGDDGVLSLQIQIYVPNMDGLRELILDEAHSLQYSIHPSVANMYSDLKRHYWWRRMKKDIVGYVSRCLNYQQVKYEHQRPGGLLHKIEILK
ncbi:uncharacterized protein [Nicotiana sylvestris]|uniref:uncharacterized protein n=1 Tax=Nicotiana sylvestris TaxID=4096 RepID=UPI00388C4BCA